MKLHLRASTASGSSGLSPPAVVAPGLRTTRPRDVSSAKQLFIDRRFVATTVGDCTLSTATPVLNPQPVLVADRPWEDGGIGAYNTVLREPDGRHRMWYHALKFLPTNLTGMPAEADPQATHFRTRPHTPNSVGGNATINGRGAQCYGPCYNIFAQIQDSHCVKGLIPVSIDTGPRLHKSQPQESVCIDRPCAQSTQTQQSP